MKLKTTAVACLLAVASLPASAALSSRDSSFGAGTLTFDHASGLEWLDLTVTRGQSFNAVAGLLDSTYKGFRFATPDEVLGFFSSGGVTPGRNASASGLLDLWGTLGSAGVFGFGASGSIALTAQERDIGLFQNHVAYKLSYSNLPLVGSYSVIASLPVLDSFGPSYVGSALVRAVSPVPEPATYGMMVAGLGILSLMARRKKKSARNLAAAAGGGAN